MGNFKVLGLIGGEVVRSYDEQAGVNPAQVLADAAIADTGAAISGVWIVESGDDSAVLASSSDGGTVSVSKIAGSASISVAKDTASSINVYVEGGTIQIQNTTGADATISAKIL